jgi:predicted TIM-barrel fold metal-dependent hydrolase
MVETSTSSDHSSKIDVHHHFEPTGKNAGGKAWSVQMSLEQMDRNGVRTAIAYAGPFFGDETTPAQQQAREANEWAADLCRTFPGRFGLFASVPFDDIGAAPLEIAHAYDALGADGIGLAPRYGSAWLGDAKYRPIFEELNRRRAVVYVHPHRSSSCHAIATLNRTDDLIAAAWIEYPTDTARTILSLWAGGVTRDFPNIRFLFCHGGGVLPILLGRFAGFTGWHDVGPERLKAIFPDGVYAEFAKLYFECAQAFAPEAVTMLRSLVPASHLLFGTDFSYFPIAHSVAAFNALELPPDVHDAIACDNATALLPRWARARRGGK